MYRCRAFCEWGSSFSVFFSLDLGSRRTQISKKIQKPKYLAEKKKKRKNPIRKSLGSGTLTRLQNFRVYLSQTAWTSDSEGIWGFRREPACMQMGQRRQQAAHRV